MKVITAACCITSDSFRVQQWIVTDKFNSKQLILVKNALFFFTFIVLLLLSFNTSFARHGGSKPSRYKQILDDKSGLYTALGNKLHAGQVMPPNSYLLFSNKMYLSLMQSDGKFINYSNS